MTLREWLESKSKQICHEDIENMAIKLGLEIDYSDYNPHFNSEGCNQINEKNAAMITEFQIKFGLDEEF